MKKLLPLLLFCFLAPASAAEAPQLQPAAWQRLWRDVWGVSAALYDVQPAANVQGDKACQATVPIGQSVEQHIRAMFLQKHGDVLRHMGEFQDRLLCLTLDGVQGVEMALAMYTTLALSDSKLSAVQKKAVVQGTFNLGVLAFDQFQYTGYSWWVPVIDHHNREVRQLLRDYPMQTLGLWFYDFPRGRLVQVKPRSSLNDPLGELLDAFDDPRRFARGACGLLAMADESFVCSEALRASADPAVARSTQAAIAAAKSGSRAGAAGTAGATTNNDPVACAMRAVAASNTSYSGWLSCVSRATRIGQGTIADFVASNYLQAGIPNNQCALRQDGGATPKPKSTSEKLKELEQRLDARNENVKKLAGEVKDLPPAIEPARSPYLGIPKAMKQIYDAVTPFKKAAERAEDQNYRTEEGWRDRNRPGTSTDNKMQTPDGTGGGSCGDATATNAALRMQALYQCSGGASPGDRVAGALGGHGPQSMPQPDQAGRGASGPIACLLQGGGLVRSGVTDLSCRQKTCPPDQTCACEGLRDIQVDVNLMNEFNNPNLGAKDPAPWNDTGRGGNVPIKPPVPPPPR